MSPYEFMIYWTVELAEYSRRPDWDDATFPAKLTERGIKKLANKKDEECPKLIGGEDSVSYTHLTLPTNREV